MAKNPYLGQRGSYFATHRVTGDVVICVWKDLTERGGRSIWPSYYDPEYTADAAVKKWIEAREWLLNADKVMLTVSETDDAGNPTRERKDYVALFSIKNCRVEADGLHFDFDKRLESY